MRWFGNWVSGVKLDETGLEISLAWKSLHNQKYILVHPLKLPYLPWLLNSQLSEKILITMLALTKALCWIKISNNLIWWEWSPSLVASWNRPAVGLTIGSKVASCREAYQRTLSGESYVQALTSWILLQLGWPLGQKLLFVEKQIKEPCLVRVKFKSWHLGYSCSWVDHWVKSGFL